MTDEQNKALSLLALSLQQELRDMQRRCDQQVATAIESMRVEGPLFETAWEKRKREVEAQVAALVPFREPRAFCKTLYEISERFDPSFKEHFVCSACEEVWAREDLISACEHEYLKLCVCVPVEYRTPLAQKFYTLAKEKGY